MFTLLQIVHLSWLRAPGQHATTKMAKSDFEKRQEIVLELVYWVFDSFLVPLVRSNFHVTESNVHRNRLFYFRHDVWRMLTEPSLSTLRLSMFEEMPTERATKLLSLRPLGFSKIRLLPKRTGVRLITNLKRRQQVMRNGTMVLGRSINAVVAPVFNVITYEKVSTHSEGFRCQLNSAVTASREIWLLALFRRRHVPQIGRVQAVVATARPRKLSALLCKSGRAILLRYHSPEAFTDHDRKPLVYGRVPVW